MLKKIMPLVGAFMMLCGCASSGLVHDKNYLRAVSISGEADKNITFSFFSDSVGSVSVSEGSLDAALEKAELLTGKPLFTGYTELVILGRCDYAEILETLLNDWRVSPTCQIVYSESGERLLSRKSAEVLSGTVEQSVRQEKAPKSDIITVLGELLGGGHSAELPELSRNGEQVSRHIISSDV